MSYPRLYQWLLGDRVPQGPFKGMRYIRACVGSALWPKLIGTYELELNDSIEAMIRWQPDVIVNAGAAEGYYAVGMALRCPNSRIAAFEVFDEGRKLLKLLADRNRVMGGIELAEELTCKLLQEQLSVAKRPALILDVEGAELDLIDFGRCPALENAFVILETHDVPGGSTYEEMRRRFHSTHNVEVVPIQTRSIHHLPSSLQSLAKFAWRDSLIDLMKERPAHAPPWLRMKPRE